METRGGARHVSLASLLVSQQPNRTGWQHVFMTQQAYATNNVVNRITGSPFSEPVQL